MSSSSESPTVLDYSVFTNPISHTHALGIANVVWATTCKFQFAHYQQDMMASIYLTASPQVLLVHRDSYIDHLSITFDSDIVAMPMSSTFKTVAGAAPSFVRMW